MYLAIKTRAAAQNTLHWLSKLVENNAVRCDRHAIYTLAAIKICKLLNDELALECIELTKAIITQRPVINWASSDLFSALVGISEILSFQEYSRERARAEAYLRALNSCLESKGVGGNILLETLNGRYDQDADSLKNCDILSIGYDSTDGLIRTLAIIEHSSGFGTKTICAPFGLDFILEGAAIANLRGRDLLSGMRILRALRYINKEVNYCTCMGLDFLELCQAPEGWFGDFEASYLKIAKQFQGAPYEPDDVCDFELKLPTTTQALWTMGLLEEESFNILQLIFSELKSFLGGGHAVCQAG